MSRAASRISSNSGSASAALARFSMKPTRTCPSASWRLGSTSACLALSLNVLVWTSIASACRLADRRRLVGHAGEHLGDMAGVDADVVALQLAGHVHQAAEVAGEQGAGAARGNAARLLLDDRVRDVRI